MEWFVNGTPRPPYHRWRDPVHIVQKAGWAVFFPEYRVVYDKMEENLVELDRSQVAIWRLLVCWISKATREQAHASPLHAHPHTHAHVRTHPCVPRHTHTQEYVILIAFRLQKWFWERTWILRYTYISSLLCWCREVEQHIYCILYCEDGGSNYRWSVWTFFEKYPSSRSVRPWPNRCENLNSWALHTTMCVFLALEW